MDETMMPSVYGPTHHPTTPHQVSLPRLAAGRVEQGGGGVSTTRQVRSKEEVEEKEKGRRVRTTLEQTEASAQILDNISVLMCWNKIKTKSSGFYGNSETEFFLHDDRFKL